MWADDDDPLERGISADKVYAVGDIDSVDLATGNVVIAIPLGGSFPVGPSLSYSLSLVYNAQVWDKRSTYDDPEPPNLCLDPYDLTEYPCYFERKMPNHLSNAGLGWSLSLGRLLDPSDPGGHIDVSRFTYVSPDGSTHSFDGPLHFGDPVGSASYSHDGAYLRLRSDGTNRIVDFPDGTKRVFESASPGKWRLKRIQDQWGNWIEVEYSATQANPPQPVWIIKDNSQSPFRENRVYFTTIGGVDHVDRVELTSPAGTASYQLEYEYPKVHRGRDHTDPDVYPYLNDLGEPASQTFPFLTRLNLPDGTSYRMKDGDPLAPAYYKDAFDPAAGSLSALTVPTGATVRWDYSRWLYYAKTTYQKPAPGEPCPTYPQHPDPNKCFDLNTTWWPGIAQRSITDVDGQTPLGTWDYRSKIVWRSDRTLPEGEVGILHEERRTIVTAPDGNDTVHYFRALSRPMDTMSAQADFRNIWDYALPYTRRCSNSAVECTSGPFLSVEYYQGSIPDGELTGIPLQPSVAQKKRSLFVQYWRDRIDRDTNGADQYRQINRYPIAEKTVFHDDSNHWIQTQYSSYDGFGNMRRATTTSSYPNATPRTTFTGFNPPAGNEPAAGWAEADYPEYILPTTGTQYWDPAAEGSYAPWPEASAWIVGTADAQTVYDAQTRPSDGPFLRTETCVARDGYNKPVTGFVLRQRQLRRTDGVRDGRDLLSTFASNTQGMVQTESNYGGDSATVGGAGTVPSGSLCNLTPPTPTYTLNHTYQNGVRATTVYAGSTLKILDRAIHSSGAITQVRDQAGVATDYQYDQMRLRYVQPADAGAWVEYKYTAATVDGASPTGPQLEIIRRPHGVVAGQYGSLGHERYAFDGLGRPIMSERVLAESSETTPVWSQQTTQYDLMGRKLKVSEVEGSTPSRFTEYAYDWFGRPTEVKHPDYSSTNLHKTTLSYSGARIVNRQVRVATAKNSETAQTTTETYDHLSRLVKVQEPGGPVTNYSYAVGGQLSGVTMASAGTTQQRSFLYDGRGFLTKEDTPERLAPTAPGSDYQMECREQVGGGYVDHDVCSFFDARGKLLRTYDGDVLLVNTYDSMGRLTSMGQKTVAGTTLLKEFTYFASNFGDDKRAGKLATATAHNRFDGSTDFTISEQYAYADARGRISQKKVVAGGDTFTQSFTWNDLGQIDTQTYPQLAGVGPTRTVANEYTYGWLTAVPGYAPSAPGPPVTLGISYHPNGMVSRVRHANGMLEEQYLAADKMARPSRFRTYDPQDQTGPDWNSETYSYDGAGNIMRIGDHVTRYGYYVYDGMGRLTTGAPRWSWHKQDYQYDAFGNLQQTQTTKCTRRSGNNCVASVVDTRVINVDSGTNRLGTGASYDAAGNLTSLVRDTVSTSYSWYPTGALRWMRRGSGPEWDYRYTVDGERIVTRQKRATDDEILTYTLRDLSGKPLRTYRKANGTWLWERDYIYRDRLLLATVSPGRGVWHAHVDHLGSVRWMTAWSKGERSYHEYFPYGEEVPSIPTSTGTPLVTYWDAEPTRFTGHERDHQGTLDAPADDLDYMHARYYAPMLGRFLSVDRGSATPTTSRSWNRYGYVLQNPMIMIDPDGLDPRSHQYLQKRVVVLYSNAHRPIKGGTLREVTERGIARATDIMRRGARVNLDVQRFEASVDVNSGSPYRGTVQLSDGSRQPLQKFINSQERDTAVALVSGDLPIDGFAHVDVGFIRIGVRSDEDTFTEELAHAMGNYFFLGDVLTIMNNIHDGILWRWQVPRVDNGEEFSEFFYEWMRRTATAGEKGSSPED